MAKQLLQDARKSIEKKDYDGCLNICAEIIQLEKDNYTGICYKGLALHKLGRNEEAQKAYEQATQIQPDSGLAWQGLVELHKGTNQWKKLKEALVVVCPKFVGFVTHFIPDSSSSAAHPKFVEYMTLLATACEKLNEPDQANGFFKQAENQLRVEEKGEKTLEQTRQKLMETFLLRIPVLKKLEEAEVVKTFKSNASVEELSNANLQIIAKAKVKRSLGKAFLDPTNDLTTVYSNILSLGLLCSKKEPLPTNCIEATTESVVRMFACSSFQNRGLLVKTCSDIVGREGINSGFTISESLLLAYQEEESSLDRKKYEELANSICFYFPHRHLGWLHWVRALLPAVEARTFSLKVPYASLQQLLKVQSDAVFAQKFKEDSQFNILVQHAAQVIYYECKARIAFSLGEYEAVLSDAVEGIKAIEAARKNHIFGDGGFFQIWLRLKLCIALSHRFLDNVPSSLATYNQMLTACPTHVEALRGLADITFELGKLEDTRKAIKSLLKASPEDHWAVCFDTWFDFSDFMVKHKDNQDFDVDAKRQLLKLRDRIDGALEFAPWFCHGHYWLGQIHWTIASKVEPKKSKESFILASETADEMKPRTASVILLKAKALESIGNWFALDPKTLAQATKFWKSALTISPSLQEIGLKIADGYINQGKIDKAIVLLNHAASKGFKWPLQRLGLLQVKTKNYADASATLRAALKEDKNSLECSQLLAESYGHQGKLVAAINVALKVLKLQQQQETPSDNLWYTYYQLGYFSMKVGDYEKALQYFQQSDTNQTFVLDGLAQTYKCLYSYFFAASKIDEALQYLTDGIKALDTACKGEDAKIYSLYKTLGDLYTEYYNFIYLKKDTPAEEKKWKEHCYTSIQEGTKAYRHALQNNKEEHGLYYDLGVNYWKQALCALADPPSPKRDTDFKQNSGSAAQNFQTALEIAFQQPKRDKQLQNIISTYWNALGIAKSESPAIQHHCFIKSINASNINFHPFANSALLLLTHLPQDSDQKKECLEQCANLVGRAKILDPANSLVWTLEAIVEALSKEGQNRNFDWELNPASFPAALGTAFWLHKPAVK